MLDSVLLWTLLAILLSSLIGVFLARRKKDACLKDFRGYLCTVLLKSKKRIWGRLAVETSGIEFRYTGNYWDEEHIETSFIIYKEEFGSLYILFRFLDELDPDDRKRRQRSLDKSYHPSPPRRLWRSTVNFVNTIRDALTEAVGVLALAKTTNVALRAVTSQQKYLTKVQSDLVSFVGTSYDPILERHIGNMCVLEINNLDGKVEEHVGVFKEYSPQFLEVMDIAYRDGEKVRVCDMIVPRTHAVIRHSAEPVRGTAPQCPQGVTPPTRQEEPAVPRKES